MADIAIIIGNGFDIDMGLPSKYSDFVKSKEWEDLVRVIDRCYPEESYRDYSLNGVESKGLQKGINIFRSENGKTQKVLVQ